jgi:IS5 family transposase
MKIGLLLLKEEIDKPLRKLENYRNEMPGILGVFGLDKSWITRRSARG